MLFHDCGSNFDWKSALVSFACIVRDERLYRVRPDEGHYRGFFTDLIVKLTTLDAWSTLGTPGIAVSSAPSKSLAICPHS